MKQSCAVALFLFAVSAMECNAGPTATVSCLEKQCTGNGANGVNGDEVSMLQTSMQAALEKSPRISQTSVPQQVAGYSTFDGDCFGNNLHVIESTTLSACASACDSNHECAGFSFGMTTRCVLKSKSCTKEQAVDNGWIFRKKAPTPPPAPPPPPPPPLLLPLPLFLPLPACAVEHFCCYRNICADNHILRS